MSDDVLRPPDDFLPPEEGHPNELTPFPEFFFLSIFGFNNLPALKVLLHLIRLAYSPYVTERAPSLATLVLLTDMPKEEVMLGLHLLINDRWVWKVAPAVAPATTGGPERFGYFRLFTQQRFPR